MVWWWWWWRGSRGRSILQMKAQGARCSRAGSRTLSAAARPPWRSPSAVSLQLANTADKLPTYILCCFITADYGLFCVGDYKAAEREVLRLTRQPAIRPFIQCFEIYCVYRIKENEKNIYIYEGKGMRINKDEVGVCQFNTISTLVLSLSWFRV